MEHLEKRGVQSRSINEGVCGSMHVWGFDLKQDTVFLLFIGGVVWFVLGSVPLYQRFFHRFVRLNINIYPTSVIFAWSLIDSYLTLTCLIVTIG